MTAIVRRLKDAIDATLAGGAIEAFRDVLIADTSEGFTSSPDVRAWVGRLWDLLAAFDYDYLDEAQLRTRLADLGQQAPHPAMIVWSYAEPGAPAPSRRGSIVTPFQPSQSYWPGHRGPETQGPESLTIVPDPGAWAVRAGA